jgi:hypothetical protein
MNVLSAYFGTIVDNDIKLEKRKGSVGKKMESVSFLSFDVEENLEAINLTEENKSLVYRHFKERWVLLSVKSSIPAQDIFCNLLFSMAYFIKSKYTRQATFKNMRDSIIKLILESYDNTVYNIPQNGNKLSKDIALDDLFLILINNDKCYLFIDMIWLEFYRIITSLYLNDYTTLPLNPIFAKYYIHSSKPITNLNFDKKSKMDTSATQNTNYWKKKYDNELNDQTKKFDFLTIMEKIRKWIALYWFITNIMNTKTMLNTYNVESLLLNPLTDSFEHYDFIFSYKQTTYYKIKKIVSRYFETNNHNKSGAGHSTQSISTVKVIVGESSPKKRKFDEIDTKQSKRIKSLSHEFKQNVSASCESTDMDSTNMAHSTTKHTACEESGKSEKTMMEFFISSILINSKQFLKKTTFDMLYNDFFPKIKYMPEKVCVKEEEDIDYMKNLNMEKRSMELFKQFPELAFTLYILGIYGVTDDGYIAIESPQKKILKQFQHFLKEQSLELSFKNSEHGLTHQNMYSTEKICESMLDPLSQSQLEQYSESRSYNFVNHFINADLDIIDNTYMILSFYKLCRKHLQKSAFFYSKEEIDEVLFSLETKIDIIKKEGPHKELDNEYLLNCMKLDPDATLKEMEYKKYIQTYYNHCPQKDGIITQNSDSDSKNETVSSSDIHVWFANVETKKYSEVCKEKSAIYHNYNFFLIKDDMWDSNSLLFFNHKRKTHDEYRDTYDRYISILQSKVS